MGRYCGAIFNWSYRNKYRLSILHSWWCEHTKTLNSKRGKKESPIKLFPQWVIKHIWNQNLSHSMLVLLGIWQKHLKLLFCFKLISCSQMNSNRLTIITYYIDQSQFIINILYLMNDHLKAQSMYLPQVYIIKLIRTSCELKYETMDKKIKKNLKYT